MTRDRSEGGVGAAAAALAFGDDTGKVGSHEGEREFDSGWVAGRGFAPPPAFVGVGRRWI